MPCTIASLLCLECDAARGSKAATSVRRLDALPEHAVSFGFFPAVQERIGRKSPLASLMSPFRAKRPLSTFDRAILVLLRATVRRRRYFTDGRTSHDVEAVRLAGAAGAICVEGTPACNRDGTSVSGQPSVEAEPGHPPDRVDATSAGGPDVAVRPRAGALKGP